ncbi:Peptidoglycan glycosyltransferase FtsW [Calycomorphotria hydatis]|uniref:Probable peptidoglycan glycosyltransferase FtsW n=2 Tax=Calycomorphotria hydatis TaxID=2528027 RepID=A0A517TAA5_9PLAN|nr:Peptidoglycan glycosyltransferase FtsW [Calycomorphotria hydatis]
MVYSASITSRPSQFEQIYLSRHLIQMGLGILAAVIAAHMSPKTWYRWTPYLFAGVVLLLIAVLIPGVGTKVNAAQRWLRVGGFSLQPSELAKIVLPMMTVWVWLHRGQRPISKLGEVSLLLPAVIVLPLVLLEPDLGTTLFLTLGTGIALFLAGLPLSRFVIAGAAIVPAVIGLAALRPYQWQRLTGFVDVWFEPEQAPYQVKQSLITIGSGGLFGTGLGKGWQKLSFLPEPNTDFVFAVIGEELGLIGTLGVIVLWCVAIAAGVRLCVPAKGGIGRFRSVIALTLLLQLGMQAAMNAGVATALLPPKGITHPFLSYGGSNLVTSLLALGIVLSLTRAIVAETAEAELTISAEQEEPTVPRGPHWQARGKRARRVAALRKEVA